MAEPKKRVVKRTPAQRAAENKYHKEKVIHVGINFSPLDHELVEYLDTKKSRSGYLKQLLREDMERNAGK